MKTLKTENFIYFQKLLLENSGLSLSDDKNYLLTTRLHPIATSLGYTDLDSFTDDLKKSGDPAVLGSVVEAMTTNETSFFRDSKPFNSLKELLPSVMEQIKFKKSIRIWSAACSSGQECYSIAMVMEEFLKDHPDWTYEIVGTDISDKIIDQARKGEYNQFEIQRGLTIQMMVQNFVQEGTKWRIKDELKRNVKFQNANLLHDMTHLGRFDIVFCRNVLIYFNPETKTKVLNNIHARMHPYGNLFLGACETVVNLDVPFETVPSYSGILKQKQTVPVKKVLEAAC